jgi:uncharacterized protein YqjF (DUF2071 family)
VLDGVRAAGRQARSLDHVAHRPWPLPAGRWALGQTWEDLLFAHWRVPAAELESLLPDGLELEEHEGSAWLGIAPFRLTALRLRGGLPVPRLSSFLEVNVRTYVRGPDGRSGVWFLSLDASSGLAVRAARRLYRLPYFQARASLDRTGDWRDVECARLGERGKVLSGRYRPDGDVFHAEPGSLAWFLVERYCLYSIDRTGALHRADVHHEPWELRHAEAELELTSIAPFALRGAPLCHFAARQDTLVWPLRRIADAH